MILIAVGEKVFQQGGRLPVVRVIPLQSLDERGRHRAVEEWVFAIDLLAASPTGVTREVRLRAPKLENLPIVPGRLRDKTRLEALHAGSLPNEVGIPRGAQP